MPDLGTVNPTCQLFPEVLFNISFDSAPVLPNDLFLPGFSPKILYALVGKRERKMLSRSLGTE